MTMSISPVPTPVSAAPAGGRLVAERLSDRFAARLAAQVEGGNLKPGDKLPSEQQLAETHGVSRTVVREAVHQLKSRGLLSSRQGSGVFVAPPAANQPLAFDLTLKQAGTRGIDFRPTARVFAAGVHADWPDPDYFGAVLPMAKPDGEPGTFAAEWQMLEYNRSFPSVWSGDALDSHTLDSPAFGVWL